MKKTNIFPVILFMVFSIIVSIYILFVGFISDASEFYPALAIACKIIGLISIIVLPFHYGRFIESIYMDEN